MFSCHPQPGQRTPLQSAPPFFYPGPFWAGKSRTRLLHVKTLTGALPSLDEGSKEGPGAMAKPSETLAEFAREQALARKLERLVRAELRGHDIRWIEQAFSELGPRKHIQAVRRRIAEAEAQGRPAVELGAAIVGRRYLLTPESMAEELGRAKAMKPKAAANDTDDEADAYAAFIALNRKGGK